MIDTLMQMDTEDLRQLNERYAHLDRQIIKTCSCGVKICASDELCADCEREAREAKAWKEYCFETYGVRILN